MRRVLLAICLGLVAGLAGCGGDPAPAPVPSPIVIVITATPPPATATSTAPSATPVPPTATAIPATATPPPTATPDLGATRTAVYPATATAAAIGVATLLAANNASATAHVQAAATLIAADNGTATVVARRAPTLTALADETVAGPATVDSITLTGFKAGYRDADYDTILSNQFTFTLTFHNHLARAVRTFRGKLVLSDPFGVLLETITLTVSDPLKARGTVTWDGTVDYNQFMDRDIQTRDYIEAGTVKYQWLLTQILYPDGTTETLQP